MRQGKTKSTKGRLLIEVAVRVIGMTKRVKNFIAGLEGWGGIVSRR